VESGVIERARHAALFLFHDAPRRGTGVQVTSSTAESKA
jgi:hypothetical protein